MSPGCTQASPAFVHTEKGKEELGKALQAPQAAPGLRGWEHPWDVGLGSARASLQGAGDRRTGRRGHQSLENLEPEPPAGTENVMNLPF